MGRKVYWRLSVLALLAGAAPNLASPGLPLTTLASSHVPIINSITQPRRHNALARSKLMLAWKEHASHLLPSLLIRSNPTLLASTVTSRRSGNIDQYSRDAAVAHVGLSISTTIGKRAAKIPTALWSKLKEQRPPKNAGYYYGLTPNTIFPYVSTRHHLEDSEKNQQLAMAQALSETLEEMRKMRNELQTLRREMYEMRKKITGEQDLEFDVGQPLDEVDPEVVRAAKLKRQEQFDRLGREVEKWARRKLFEEDREGNGWTEIPCNKAMGRTINPDGQITCYLNYLPDMRGKNAFKDDSREYPCIKVYGRIDAPMDLVCTYLSRREHMSEYNDILEEHRDLEEIAPHSKICLTTSPQVLFVKPREFVTFVYHRWLNDGTCVMVNQAVEHKDAPAVNDEGKGKACRGYALRGATFISPDPGDPEKTQLSFIAHAAPGGGLPQWAVKTAVGAVIPIEPFKLFHKIGENVKRSRAELEQLKLERMQQVPVPGQSSQPVGFAQIGFACFWPNGGGLLPVGPSTPAATEDQVESREATEIEKADSERPTLESLVQ